jgi:hypothetical protein
LYVWHRYAGVIAALFTLILALTGIALNNTERLKLDASYIESGWLLDWYGINTPTAQHAYQLGERWLSHVGDSLYLDEQRIDGNYSQPMGALSFPYFIAVAVAGNILLLTYEGEVIERLGGMQGVPSGMDKIGRMTGGGIVIQAAHGYYLTDRDFLKWQEQEKIADVSWSLAVAAPAALQSRIAQLYRSNELPVERVMLDLHSGRLFGSWGPLLMDIAAMLLMFLAMSGTWIWGKQIFRKRQRRIKKQHLDH